MARQPYSKSDSWRTIPIDGARTRWLIPYIASRSMYISPDDTFVCLQFPGGWAVIPADNPASLTSFYASHEAAIVAHKIGVGSY